MRVFIRSDLLGDTSKKFPWHTAELIMQFQNGRAAICPIQNRRRLLVRDRAGAYDLPPLAVAVRGDAVPRYQSFDPVVARERLYENFSADPDSKQVMLKYLAERTALELSVA